jgi:multidrug efflux pump
VRNQALNSIGNTGHGTASTGSAVSTSAETMIPLSAVTHVGVAERSARREIERYRGRDCQPLVVDGERYIAGAVQAINAAMVRLGLPTSVHGTFQGTARAFQESVANEPYLILAALIAVCRSHPCCTAGSRWCGREATGPPCIFRRPEHRSWAPE